METVKLHPQISHCKVLLRLNMSAHGHIIHAGPISGVGHLSETGETDLST